MTLKSDVMFDKNADVSFQKRHNSKTFHFDVLLLSIPYKISAKKV